MEKESKPKSKKVYIPLAVVVLIIAVGGWMWYSDYTKYITTDDARVDSDNASVSSKIIGRIAKLYANEGDSVKKGTLLAELDSADLLAQRQQIEATEIQAKAAQTQAEAKLNFDEENIKVMQVSVDRAKEDLDRANLQYNGGIATKEQLDHTKKSYETAKAQVEASKVQLEVSRASIGSAKAQFETAKAQVNVLETQLKNTRLYSPLDGIVAKRWLLAGDVAQPGQSLMTITNTNQHWIIVYIEEVKLSELHVGQDAIFTIDAFSGTTFKGKIYSIGSNTAAMFSLIPQNNASGNFTKTTQRVPLKVSIDGVEGNGKLSDFNILTGMSAVMKIIK